MAGTGGDAAGLRSPAGQARGGSNPLSSHRFSFRRGRFLGSSSQLASAVRFRSQTRPRRTVKWFARARRRTAAVSGSPRRRDRLQPERRAMRSRRARTSRIISARLVPVRWLDLHGMNRGRFKLLRAKPRPRAPGHPQTIRRQFRIDLPLLAELVSSMGGRGGAGSLSAMKQSVPRGLCRCRHRSCSAGRNHDCAMN